MAFPADIELSSLNGENGFLIKGIDPGDYLGSSVSGAGDVNGDGYDDLIIGAPTANDGVGASYVIFGRAGGFTDELDLSALDGTNGFQVEGREDLTWNGFSVSSGGDINGDGFADLFVSASGGFGQQEYFVVFGKSDGFSASFKLSTIDGTNGFSLVGGATHLVTPSSSIVGDVNGDGFDDILIGDYADYPDSAYLVYGKENGFPVRLDLSTLDGTNGTRFFNKNREDEITYDESVFGISVSGAGDFNGDGFDDLLIGSNDGYTNYGSYRTGHTYIVFGRAGGFSHSFDVSSLDGSDGFVINGIDPYGYSSLSLSGVGDFNADGFDDIIIGAFGASPNGDFRAGQSYVVFGKANDFSPSFELSSLDGSNGFVLNGIEIRDKSGWSVSSAGDFNNDGFDDVIIGAKGALKDPTSASVSDGRGQSFVVFGSEDGHDGLLELSELDGRIGFALNGVNFVESSGRSVSGAGDFNGDGFDDVIVGAPDPYGDNNFGNSYIVFGATTEPTPVPEPMPFPAEIELSEIAGTYGDVFSPGGSVLGWSVSGIGDFNGDGFDDAIVGDPYGTSFWGISYIIFGSADGISDEYIRLNGVWNDDGVGRRAAGAVDINGDGFDDLVVAAPRALAEEVYYPSEGDYYSVNPRGQSYVIFGSENPTVTGLNDVDGSNGFAINGLIDLSQNGSFFSLPGDVNNDGFDDIAVGRFVVFGKPDGFPTEIELDEFGPEFGIELENGSSPVAAGDFNGDGYADFGIGSSVVFGNAGGLPDEVDWLTLDGSNGFSIKNGPGVSGYGDFNGDGFDDLIAGDRVIFGSEEGMFSEIDLSTLDGSNGFRLVGGSVIANAGDVNGDGFDDIVAGVGYDEYATEMYGAGATYILYGTSDEFPAEKDLTKLDGKDGFTINGDDYYLRSGFSVDGAGDFNGDGYDDFIMGSPEWVFYIREPDIGPGSAYVIFGAPSEAPPPPVEDVLFRVNAGGMTVSASDGGPDWGADTAAVNSAYLIDAANNKVVDYIDIPPSTLLPSGVPSEVFESQRAAAPWSSDMTWAFDVPDAGRYQVNLFLREWWTGASDPGDRVFDVAVEGNVPAAFDDIDAASDFGFRNGGVVSSTVEVTDGTLDLTFLSEIGNPMMNAIEIVALDAPPPPPAEVLFRVNAGGMTVAATDGGPDWSADTAAANSAYLVDAANNKVTDELVFNPATTPLPPGVPSELFESQRAAAPWSSDMTWAFNVPEAGFFEVNLYLREFWNGASDPGDRVFDVAVEGNVPAAFDDIDAASDFGFRNGGRVSTTVEVTDGTLDLTFLSEVGNPMVNAIEIVALDAPPVDDFVF